MISAARFLRVPTKAGAAQTGAVTSADLLSGDYS
jgi:hypothetical protein